MAKRTRGRGVLKGAVGYPGKKINGAYTMPEAEDGKLRQQETRIGASKSCLITFALRKVKLERYHLADIKQDIESAERGQAARKTDMRRARWKRVLSE